MNFKKELFSQLPYKWYYCPLKTVFLLKTSTTGFMKTYLLLHSRWAMMMPGRRMKKCLKNTGPRSQQGRHLQPPLPYQVGV